MEFEEVELGQISNVTKLAGYEFTNNIKYTNDGDIIAIRALNIKNGKLDLSQVKKITKETSNNLLRSKLYKNDIVLTYTGSKYGEVALINQNEKFHLAPNVCKVTVASNVNPYYIFLIMQTRSFKIQMKNFGVGSSQPTIPMKNIRKLKILLPSLEHQNKIVKVLKSLDEKIDLNYKLVTNLEKLSQTLFKHWFVDFEFPDKNGNPYKSSGGEMVDSELGEIPKGWRVETLEKLGSIVGGGTPSKKNKEYYTNNGIPWITPKDLSKNRNIYISHGENDISELGLNKSSAKLLEKNSVLFSSRAPIGYIAINNIPVTTNQGFKSIVPNEEMNPYFIYFILKNITPLIEQTASGSTFKEISAKGLKSIKIVFPSIELIEHYGNIVKKYFEEINFLENQNIKLIELRDTLLPKLMSGEIEIPDDIEVNNDELSI